MTRSFGDEMLHAILRLHINQYWPRNAITDDNITEMVGEIKRRADTQGNREAVIDIASDVIARFCALHPLVGKDWTKPYAAKTA